MLDRRSILKSIAALPVTIYLSSCSRYSNKHSAVACPQTMNLLSVVFHGLYTFICDRRANKILVYTPKVAIPGHMHVYRAGSWTPPHAPCTPPETHEPSLCQDDCYILTLDGYTGYTTFPTPNLDSEVWLSPTITPITVDLSKSYCSLVLPATPFFRHG